MAASSSQSPAMRLNSPGCGVKRERFCQFPGRSFPAARRFRKSASPTTGSFGNCSRSALIAAAVSSSVPMPGPTAIASKLPSGNEGLSPIMSDPAVCNMASGQCNAMVAATFSGQKTVTSPHPERKAALVAITTAPGLSALPATSNKWP